MGLPLLSERVPNEGTTVNWIKGIYLAIAEIAHQQVTGELPKIRGSQGQAPGGIECSSGNQASKQISIQIKHIHKAIPGPGTSSFHALQSIGDIKVATQDFEC